MKRAVVYDRVTAEQRAELDKAIDQLGFDERAVLLAIAGRLVMGAAQYGQLKIDTDKRDWKQELMAEILDSQVYTSIALIRAQRVDSK